MKKSAKWLKFLFFSIILGSSLTFNSCNFFDTDDSGSSDSSKSSKTEITNVAIVPNGNKIVITWTNPTDEDYAVTKVTFTPDIENAAQGKTVPGKAGGTSLYETSIKYDILYTFTLTPYKKDSSEYKTSTEVSITVVSSEIETAKTVK